jgi:hypothetical protein
MQVALSALDAALGEVDRLRRTLKKNSSQVQVRSLEERAQAKSTALAWFNNHRAAVAAHLGDSYLTDSDAAYKALLESSARHGARGKYLTELGALKANLVNLRTDCLAPRPARTGTRDDPPDFSPLIADVAMQAILLERWNECLLCLGADASLAATVMMGGLLEALLLARINREGNKAPIFMAKGAPKDKQGATKPLGEWMLQHYITVVYELKWISVSARDVGAVLRDYRNYVHPFKQLSHGVHLTPDDAKLFWEITKTITRQVVASVP